MNSKKPTSPSKKRQKRSGPKKSRPSWHKFGKSTENLQPKLPIRNYRNKFKMKLLPRTRKRRRKRAALMVLRKVELT